MVRWLTRSLQWLQGGTLRLLLLGGGVLLVWGVLAPVGTLTWWLSQSAEQLGLREPKRLSNGRTPKEAALPSSRGDRKAKSNGSPSKPSSPSAQIDCYIVYFPGVGDYSANQLTSGEEFFLNHLTQQHPDCVAVSDVFPYSASNISLGGERTFAPLWTTIEQADGWLENFDVLIKIRNLWRFAISADDRYGQVYNRGVAIAIVEQMNAAHPIPSKPGQALKVILVGTSGGAQVALGAAPYLKQWLNPQLIVVSVGGDFEGKVGFESADQIYHLQGSQDWIEDLSSWLFPSRWGITVGSPFNQAQWQGRYSVQTIGPHEHDGEQGYFGLSPVANSQTTYVELTLQQVNQLPIWRK